MGRGGKFPADSGRPAEWGFEWAFLNLWKIGEVGYWCLGRATLEAGRWLVAFIGREALRRVRSLWAKEGRSPSGIERPNDVHGCPASFARRTGTQRSGSLPRCDGVSCPATAVILPSSRSQDGLTPLLKKAGRSDSSSGGATGGRTSETAPQAHRLHDEICSRVSGLSTKGATSLSLGCNPRNSANTCRSVSHEALKGRDSTLDRDAVSSVALTGLNLIPQDSGRVIPRAAPWAKESLALGARRFWPPLEFHEPGLVGS